MQALGSVTRGGAVRRPVRASDPELKAAPGLPCAADRHGDAGWSSPVARQAHNLKVAGSNPAPATIVQSGFRSKRIEELALGSHLGSNPSDFSRILASAFDSLDSL